MVSQTWPQPSSFAAFTPSMTQAGAMKGSGEILSSVSPITRGGGGGGVRNLIKP